MKAEKAMLILLAASALTPAAALAQAQTGAAASTQPAGDVAASPPAAAPSNSVGEIVVTAQRRSERILDVPISISVVGGAQAQAAGVVSTRDLSQVTPGLVEGQAGYVFQPAIRGISSTGTSVGDESNVATYIDNVYIAATGATAFNLANIDHIEVLKGPQGTLFGRNATGGAIRVVTTAPSFTPELEATGSIGLDGPDSKEVSAYGSTALTDQLAGSLALYYYDDDGYLKNPDPSFKGPRQGSLTDYTARAKLLYKPTNRLKVTGEFDYGQSISGVELTTTFVNGVDAFKNVTGVIPAIGDFEVTSNEENYDKGLNYGGYVNVEYQTDHFTLTSLSAYRVANVTAVLDNDRTNLPINLNNYKADVRTFSQEFNLTSNFSGPLNFVSGLYYFREDAANPFFNSYAATLGPVTNGTRSIVKPLSLASSLFDDLQTESYSAFGEATYKLTRQLSIVGGLRYNIDHKDAYSSNLLAPTSPPVSDSGSWDNVTYRVTLNYKPTYNTLFYFSNSTGFKSGLINAASYPYPAQHQQVLPEEVTAYEGGFKGRFFGFLSVEASAFHYDYKDIQLTVNNALSAAAGTVGINILENAAAASITGADLQLDGRLNEHWSGQIGVSYLPQAEYSNFNGGIHYVAAPGGLGAVASAADLSGSRLPRAPKETLNLGLTYQTPLAGGKLTATANYYLSSSAYLVVGELVDQPTYNVLGGELGWTDPSGRYTVSVWGRNLTNEAYYISGLANTGGFSAVWSKPREVGLRLHVHY